MATRIRKNAGKLPAWDDTFRWYAVGIREMQKLSISRPTSWRYQAAVHDYTRARDPYRDPSDIMPTQQEQTTYWRKCQHFSWFFLPWHRMYLGYFERMIISAITPLGGPSDWALPYWNYSDGPDSRKLPQAFVDMQMPDHSPNPLRVTARAQGNNGDEVGDDTDVELEDCLTQQLFEAASAGGSPGFGGPRTGFKHALQLGEPARFGALENTPHGTMHGAVGGWMGAFDTAALDPIFWLHHCNIDRLWEVWLRRKKSRPNQFTDPSDAAWNTAISFDLHDEHETPVSLTPADVRDTEASRFAYKYDDITDPLGPTPEGAMVPEGAKVMGMGRIPEMVGATETGLTLTGQRLTTQIAVSPPSGPALEAPGEPKRTILNIENITADRRANGYAVYVNLPEGGDPANYRDRFAGNIPLFGIDATENPDNLHASDGLHYALDISRVVRDLQMRGQWNPGTLRLTFIPKNRRGGLEAAADEVPVKVGRVSLYTE
jgi:tyrosinase